MGAVNARARWPLFVGSFIVIFLLVGSIHQNPHERLPEATKKYWPFRTHYAQNKQSFYDIAKKYGTDKVTDHSFQDMYEMYLEPYRNRKFKMLEIGLGCDMSYGPGASYYTWREYFPFVDLYFLEYDADCAAKWADKITGATIVAGDQGEGAVLDRFIAEHGADFDIIIDDGGHTMHQQIISLKYLWKAIKPGGIYFCEDTHTSALKQWGGGPAEPGEDKMLMMDFIHKLVEDITYEDRFQPARQISFEQVESMVHIDCSRELCGFFKRAANSRGRGS